ncbi:Sds3-like-domain-containing protein [Powellomyces hirtus]|nr:Sds3-like-domain-containing protein [Powellomyces hirtus]
MSSHAPTFREAPALSDDNVIGGIRKPFPAEPSTAAPFHRPSLLAVPEPGAIVVPVATPKKSHKARKPKAKVEKPVEIPEKELKEVVDQAETEAPLTKKERKHKEMMERLEKLNRDFLSNKDRIFIEKVSDFKDGARQVLGGSHPEFQDIARTLEDDRNKAIVHAELFRDYQMECAAFMYRHEHDIAIADFKKEKEAVRERMLAVLEDKKRKVRDDRENFDVSHIVAETTIEDHRTGTRKATRSHAAKNPEEKKEKRRKIASLAGIVVAAPEDVALNDLSIIRRVRRR